MAAPSRRATYNRRKASCVTSWALAASSPRPEGNDTRHPVRLNRVRQPAVAPSPLATNHRSPAAPSFRLAVSDLHVCHKDGLRVGGDYTPMEISGKVGRRETLSVEYLDMPKSRLVEHSETARMVRRLHTTALNLRSIIRFDPEFGAPCLTV